MNHGIIFGNKILDVVFIAWFIAQFYKVIVSIITEKKLNIRRLWGTGGMPSSHSSTVASLTTCIALKYGIRSDIFAVTIIFSGIVMYDAAGIRREAGKQAGVLNKYLGKIPLILGEDRYRQYFGERTENLKELLGHSPVEVIIGMLLGIVVGICFKGYIQG